MEKTLNVTDVRNNFSEIIDEVRYREDTVILIKSGKPAAAIIPMALYEKLMQLESSKSTTVESGATKG